MKSIGISVRGASTSSHDAKNSAIQLHLNLWKYPHSQKKHRQFCNKRTMRVPFNLDIGIMGKFSIKEIRLYLPFPLNSIPAYMDLAPILIHNKTVLCSLFNDNYEVIYKCGNFTKIGLTLTGAINKYSSNKESLNATSKLCTELKDAMSGDKDSSQDTTACDDKTPKEFYIYELQKKDVSVTNYSKKGSLGNMLTISIPEPDDPTPCPYFYIRLRIAIWNSKSMVYNSDLSNDWLQSAFTKLDMYNIQINELRDIPDIPVLDLLAKPYKCALISKIHMLYVSSPEVEIKTGSSAESDSRLIESEKWGPYIPQDYMANVYLAHHWKFTPDKSPDPHKMQLFFTAEYPERHYTKIARYLSGVLLLGFFGSLIASILYALNSTAFNKIAVLASTSVFLCLLLYLIDIILQIAPTMLS